jgi:hypothetical protein
MFDDDGIEAAYARAKARATAYTLPNNVQVVRSHGPTTRAEVFARASKAMDYEDRLLQLRGEYIYALPLPRKSFWDYFRRLVSHSARRR